MIDNKCQLDKRNLLDSLLSAVVRGGYHGTESTLDWIMPESCQINVVSPNNHVGPSNTHRSIFVFDESNELSNVETYNIKDLPTSSYIKVSSHRSFLEVENTETASNESVFRTETASENILGENAVEAVLLIAGETRTLRYQMFDRQGNPVPIPDLRSLYQILEVSLFFSLFK
ncbi:hypothetical protein DICVIV_01495 [Dictyocaulus viviparus]|uniref:Uncharacterized protein n=1 Tax=Dictyocaulus viviparus TaxID=29172 RepID=A0A0D8Y628_DICVI|nr:hypothetical protein DICVIV_01495 [Dictyocaulus viviparus]